MYNPTYFSQSDVDLLRSAFETMNGNDDDLAILDDVLGTPGITIPTLQPTSETMVTLSKMSLE